ncbi:PAS domain-containing sensor histidine kinase [Sutcliffiella sp. NC1]|uniref:PAS domain-containing sensor histidine kinase n=1 Tax=Sutcliffiella sp. NC1 TaxID=3004096 RepID=UPI0022DE3311|nr:PAS domain-containing sensor histidine kinase [Sutcliffiella sp. NC1]WBL17249.1 PAS domain S-box protein [Sutcliffiella sp. NC1]
MTNGMKTDETVGNLQKELAKLKQENELKDMLFREANDALVILNKESYFVLSNPKACQLFDLTEEELKKRTLYDFLQLMTIDEVKNQKHKIDSNGQHRDELILKLDNGDIKIVEYTVVASEERETYTVVMREARKVVDYGPTRRAPMYQEVFTRAIDGIVLFDREGDFIDVNPAFCSSLSQSKYELIHNTLYDLVEEQYRFKIEKMWRFLEEYGRVRGELPITTNDGVTKLFEFSITANIYDDYYLGIMRDVTGKRNMELQLQRSEERFRQMFQKATDPIVLLDNNGIIVRANPVSSRTFEAPLDELIGADIRQFLPKESYQRFGHIARQFIMKGEIREELLFHMANGQSKLLEFTASKGTIDGYNIVIFRNVSERRKMEKDLRESEQKFRKIFDNAMDGIVLWDEQFTIIDVNANASKIIGVEKEQIVNKTFYHYLTSEKMKPIYKSWKNFSEQGELSGEYVYETNKGNRIIEYSAKKNVIPGLHMTFFRDITDKREMEEQLKKSDTLNVVGELAAGIAHEIRNPMTALKGFIQLLQSSVDESKYSMYFDVISSELNRIESIITEFLVLAKPQAISYEKKDVTKIMKETLDLMSAQAVLENVQFETFFASEKEILYCEPKQLKQVFINILKNAIEVMPKGGTVTISISEKNDYVTISIKDQGIGIPEDKLKKLGEPFYTTKDRGTGLGLMVSYKIVEEHKGYIEVDSEVGKGTTFHIYLPKNLNER